MRPTYPPSQLITGALRLTKHKQLRESDQNLPEINNRVLDYIRTQCNQHSIDADDSKNNTRLGVTALNGRVSGQFPQAPPPMVVPHAPSGQQVHASDTQTHTQAQFNHSNTETLTVTRYIIN